MTTTYFARLSTVLALAVLNVSTLAQTPTPAHDPAAHAASGKNNLADGIIEADFLKLGDQPKSVKVTLVSAFNDVNGGMNFDGFSHGKAVFTIPTGWKVDVSFINPSPVPHSLVVVEKEMVKKLQVGEPIFAGATTPNATVGLSGTKAAFTFTASEAGDYAFVCGFPAHGVAGHWVSLKVSDTAKAPSLKLGDAPEKEIK